MLIQFFCALNKFSDPGNCAASVSDNRFEEVHKFICFNHLFGSHRRSFRGDAFRNSQSTFCFHINVCNQMNSVDYQVALLISCDNVATHTTQFPTKLGAVCEARNRKSKNRFHYQRRKCEKVKSFSPPTRPQFVCLFCCLILFLLFSRTYARISFPHRNA